MTPEPLTRWPEGLTARLAQLERLDPTTPRDWYADEYRRGRLDLWAWGERCWILTRVERMPGGAAELVLVAAIADAQPGDAFTDPALAAFEDLARQLGCRSARLHTSRIGLLLIATERGWQHAEHVLRKGLD